MNGEPPNTKDGQGLLQQLDQLIKPGVHLRVFVPSRDRNGHPLPANWLMDFVENEMVPIAGGSTTLRGVGHWEQQTGVLTREQVDVVEVYVPDTLSPNKLHRLVRCLSRVAIEGEQDAIAIAVDGRLVVIPRSTIEEE